MAEETGIKGAIERFKEGIGDLSSLEVQTISGTLEGLVHDTDSGSIIDWTKAVKSAKESGTVKLVLATKINFDGDATQFVREGEISQYMLDAHAEALAAGKATREELMALVVSTTKSIFD